MARPRRPAGDLRPGHQTQRQRGEAVDPGARARVPQRRLVAAYVLAILLPLVTALVLVPFREDHSTTAAIVLVVPVVIVATFGAAGPSVLAALASALAFDLFLIEPYNTLAVDDPDEVVAVAALLVVGLIVSWLSSRVVQLGATASGRSNELDHVLQFSQAAVTTKDPMQLIDQAVEHITAVLDLESCRWEPGRHAGPEPVLLTSGQLMGYLNDLNPDRAQLPPVCVLPVAEEDERPGNFILTPRRGSISSLEERRTAAAIARIAASRLGGPSR